ncbi:uncharacterized protein LY79DRAFT_571913 [Colletotrichum navitas]|uniref:Uncharacterized protein n=1 Tax=Colletotrichum navitas TaxID=681940 RepID=A0AAD8PLF3_9PEZI|nr:uncharacterized protein LY79DRAFT_571913 [Colletotrichum navitas]KAK1569439.1 hypothetical protein LY79DRAFT_571913 [Colletotrichum navitas]
MANMPRTWHCWRSYGGLFTQNPPPQRVLRIVILHKYWMNCTRPLMGVVSGKSAGSWASLGEVKVEVADDRAPFQFLQEKGDLTEGGLRDPPGDDDGVQHVAATGVTGTIDLSKEHHARSEEPVQRRGRAAEEEDRKDIETWLLLFQSVGAWL